MKEIQIPKFGMSTVEVDVVDIFIEVGDRVDAGDALIEVESEKVTLVIESEYSGVVLEVLVAVDQTCSVGDVFCRLDTP